MAVRQVARAPLALVLAAALIAGCGLARLNAPLERWQPDSGYRIGNLADPENSDSLLVVLTFSGGGTRAAALAYGVLEELRRTRIVWEGRERRLLDEVDLISSISGGSFTAAYFGLFGDRIFRDFAEKFLYRDIEDDLLAYLFSVPNAARLLFSNTTRSEIAAAYYDDLLFRGKTFGDLLARGRRPYLLINATDLDSGERFAFTQAQFDLLCSDLSRFPVARAVAASAAFPVAFNPLTLRNFAGGCGYIAPPWMHRAVKQGRKTATPEFQIARNDLSYLAPPPYDRPYIHLADGGIADNLGLRGPLQVLHRLDKAGGSDRDVMDLTRVRRIVFIVVNAVTQPRPSGGSLDAAPGIFRVLEVVTNAPIDSVTRDTVELAKTRIAIIEGLKAVREAAPALGERVSGSRFWPGGVDAAPAFTFAEVRFGALEDPTERDYFHQYATSFYLPRRKIDDLRAVASKLLCEQPEYAALRRTLDAQGGCERVGAFGLGFEDE